MFESIASGLYQTLVVDNRYVLILQGLKNTLIITFFSLLLGLAIGLVVAVVKVAPNSRAMRPLRWLSDLYVTVIRGTPVVVQLIIINGSILKASDNQILIAVVAFGVNSGAYVAEIIRGGILAVDRGQTEAGRSLGLTAGMTMSHIVLPQAFKTTLPSLGNEFIALLKETSVAGYVAIRDLTKAGDSIFSRTYNIASMYIVALIYLVLVIGLTALLGRLERRLHKNDHR
ncbi:MAG: amino acid ABC transporter permease [Provencibacterium sp.]|jgi:His/Glu/Gln/Arg/opine family amino acid ABC transporter permease subunit|nr:amino acid ABC transporter permease [Provencibacterium sp.]